MVEAGKNGPRSDASVSPAALEVPPEYLAGLVHELRNPLGPIRNATELLRTLSADPRQLTAIDLISRQVVTLTHMLDDLVEAARRQRGLLVLVRRTINAAELMEQALEAVRPAIEAQHQNLFVSLPSEPVQMDCDPVRLGQVIQAILGNATKYTHSGGSIAARVQRSENELILEISDDGAGIAADALPHVFNVFARSSSGSSGQGSGFSLAIARNIVELHGGSIVAESDGPGRGSRFTIRLPLDTAPHGPAPASASESIGSLKIIIIDDHEESVRGWVDCLIRGGHSVLTATTGELGVALAAKFEPDAVIIDIGLPGMDGFEVGRALQAQPGTKQAMLIAVSGYSLKQFRNFDAYAVFKHYLLKPVNPSSLLYIIETTVRHATRRA
jgi:CheY-like chemotaxis protein